MPTCTHQREHAPTRTRTNTSRFKKKSENEAVDLKGGERRLEDEEGEEGIIMFCEHNTAN